MTTRAANIQFLISGLKNPTTGEPVAGGSVEFYEAGTSTQKYVWTEKEKSNGYYTYTLGDAGEVDSLFGEGEYDIVVKDSGGSTLDTLYGIRLEQPYYGVQSVSTTPYTQVSQNDLLLVDTTSGDITINCIAAASWTRSLKVQHISGANDVIIDPNGSETIDGDSTLTFRNAVVEIASDGSNLRSVGFRANVADSDNDTKIQVEESTDEDVIRFDAGGNENMRIYASGPYNIYMSGGLNVQGDSVITGGDFAITGGDLTIDYDKAFIGKGISDADGDTAVWVEESSDEDRIRMDVKGTENILTLYESGSYNIYASGGLQITSGGLNVSAGNFSIAGTQFNTYTTFAADNGLTGTIYAAKVGRIVTLVCEALTHSSATSASTSVGLLSAAYRPVANAYNCTYLSTARTVITTVATNGTVSFNYYDHIDGSATAQTNTGGGSISFVSAS